VVEAAIATIARLTKHPLSTTSELLSYLDVAHHSGRQVSEESAAMNSHACTCHVSAN
jgi:hypothetical protein